MARRIIRGTRRPAAHVRVEIDRLDGDSWVPLASCTTIGSQRILRTEQVTTGGLRVRILESLAAPMLRDVSAFDDPERN